MRQILAFVAALYALSASGCAYMKAPPDCAKQPSPDTLSTAEKVALADATTRYAVGCTREEKQCQIEVSKNVKGEIFVIFSSVQPDRASGQCLQTPGDYRLGSYSPTGEFIGSGISL